MKFITGRAARAAYDLALICAITCFASMLLGCVYQRAEEASSAQKTMVGMTKGHILSCMGAPMHSETLRNTEILTYDSKDRGATSKLFCKVDIFMNEGLVSRINYSGFTGGLMSKDEQCAPIVESCASSESAGMSAKLLRIFRF